MQDNLFSMRGICKRFPGVIALDHVDFDIRAGEVMALVGENGAGKSTLLKILSGAYQKDEGEIFLEGEKLDIYTPQGAIDMGISIIYQELDNYQTLSVTENILVNNLPYKKIGKSKVVDWAKAHEIADKAISQITDEIDVRCPIGEYSSAKQQMAEIAKALNRNMKILVMDEPTSALNRVETEQLMKVVKQIVSTGVGIVYISHRMDEIFKLSDRIQVMRDGKKVALLETAKTNNEEVIYHMVGRKLDEMYPHTRAEHGEVVFEVKNLSAGIAKNVNFELKKGEILGLFGLMGAGRTSVCRAMFGDLPYDGKIIVDCEKAAIHCPSDAIKHGIAYVPSERKSEGLMLIHSVKENLSISIIDKLMRGAILSLNDEEKIANKWLKALNIKTPDINTSVESLSGGNQQKVVIGKWLETNPKVLILNDPTRGVDVGAKVEIYELMEELCQRGMSIIMVSSELQEMLAISDRIIVMCEGRVMGELENENVTQEGLMALAVGGV